MFLTLKWHKILYVNQNTHIPLQRREKYNECKCVYVCVLGCGCIIRTISHVHMLVNGNVDLRSVACMRIYVCNYKYTFFFQYSIGFLSFLPMYLILPRPALLHSVCLLDVPFPNWP